MSVRGSQGSLQRNTQISAPIMIGEGEWRTTLLRFRCFP